MRDASLSQNQHYGIKQTRMAIHQVTSCKIQTCKAHSYGPFPSLGHNLEYV